MAGNGNGSAPPGAAHLLVAEDDESSRRMLGKFLRSAGYQVTEVADGPAALRAASLGSVDLVLLDLGLPGISGQEVLAALRRTGGTPVVICTGETDPTELLRELDAGADDYLVKPLSLPEVEARVKAVLRRGRPERPAAHIGFDGLDIDVAGRVVAAHGARVDLTAREFDLLAFLADAPGRSFTYDDLLAAVWGSTTQWQGRATVTEHVRRIRTKLGPAPDGEEWIRTIRGVGYAFRPWPDAGSP